MDERLLLLPPLPLLVLEARGAVVGVELPVEDVPGDEVTTGNDEGGAGALNGPDRPLLDPPETCETATA